MSGDIDMNSSANSFFTLGEYGKKDLPNGEKPLLSSGTIEELKQKLEGKELLFRPRSHSPTSPGRNPFEGDYPDDMIPETRAPSLLTDDGLIAPRKPVNPVREDPGRQNLHRELLFNQKIGKSVLNQKSELQRALERHKDNLAKKQLENHIAEKTPELEKVIADRAKRLENPVKIENEEDKVISKEFLQARMKLKSTSESK
ncbi:protein FAM107B isoform X2 [Anthonomus grandis grandis]|uniref:protein FAM107B isoform X2 n=1 Tax=Anthonomus grandis grandis TaxID=2921223 RepID=UPI002165C571|nr:protein FAM107B isoform X2 [Anthonomus grandis grandis]